jgi:hypothetical protein
MKTIRKIIYLALLVLITLSCNKENCIEGNGNIITRTYSIETFNQIKTLGDFHVEIAYDSIQEVQVTGDENIITRLERDVSNELWEI